LSRLTVHPIFEASSSVPLSLSSSNTATILEH
jgi:hypothetical protein